MHKDYDITKRTTTIGRRSDNDITIDSPDVSNRHARLNFEQNYYLTDQRSSNGTYINGKKILHAKLSDGDEIHFAGIYATFYEQAYQD
ncbi:MAG: FHA domain-containing protein [Gammaproteobacteria bacterium]|nr:FHA domain-containing protein [Gammaproteobacteria bacterium]